MANSQYPTTPAELREACPRNNEGLHCLRQHVKCLKPLTKRAMLAFIDGRRKHVKKICSDLNGSNARDFTALFACIKKVSCFLLLWISFKHIIEGYMSSDRKLILSNLQFSTRNKSLLIRKYSPYEGLRQYLVIKWKILRNDSSDLVVQLIITGKFPLTTWVASVAHLQWWPLSSLPLIRLLARQLSLLVPIQKQAIAQRWKICDCLRDQSQKH